MPLGTILLIDDSDDDVFLTKRALTQAGVRNPTMVIADGSEAQKYLEGVGDYANRERYPLPCLIVMDLSLGGMDGLRLLEWLAQGPEFNRIPKVILTGSERPGDEEEARRLGCSGYFHKPASIEQLARLMSELKEKWIVKYCAADNETA